MTTLRVGRGKPRVVGLAWLDTLGDHAPFDHEPNPVRSYEPVVTHGVKVKHRAANISHPEYRAVASARRTVHTLRYAPGSIPAGVDLNITAPHDCANHLEGI